ncbi:MAG: glycoside hydrolase family 2 protein, partial [Candidatus Binataceae bacterium]
MISDLRVEPAAGCIPGAAPVTPHSLFASLSDATAPISVSIVKASEVPPHDTSPARVVSLDGEWRRRAMPDDPLHLPLGCDFDDSAWDRVFVPNNYGLEPSLSAHFGPVYYRRRIAPFDAPRVRLCFDSIDYLADVWLDDRHLGHHEGCFAPFTFDVTGAITASSVVTIRVQDPYEDWSPAETFFAHAKRAIKGTLKYHDSRPGGLPGLHTPGWTARTAQSMTTGGITGSVRLASTGDVRIDALFATPLDVAAGAIHLAIILTNCAAQPLDSTVLIQIRSLSDPREIFQAAAAASLRPGANRIDLRASVPNPRLWWPASHRDLGAPALYELDVRVISADSLSDHRATRFGIRVARVDRDPRRFVVNGRPIFVQAANYIGRQHFADVDVEFYRRDMRLAAAAHLNSFGVHGHLQPHACYDAADEEGILIFQDFALQWHYDSGRDTNPGFIDIASRQITEMAYTYWNHPSIVYWACHNEPTAMFIPDRPADESRDPDNQVLDEALERALSAVEPMRHIHR